MSRTDPQRLPDYLQHMVDAIARIQRYVGPLSKEQFLQEEKTQEAVVRDFEVMEAAARHVQTNASGVCELARRGALGADVRHAQPSCPCIQKSMDDLSTK